jgi:hypothetical protein
MILRRLGVALLAASLLLGSAGVSFAREISEVIEDLAKGEDFRLRVSAALVLGKSGESRVREPLEKALADDSHPAVRAAAAAALGAFGDPQSLDVLRKAAKSDASQSVRSASATAASKISGGKEATGGGAASEAPSKSAKVLVKIGKMTNRTTVRGKELATVLHGATRDQAAKLPGVEVLPEDSDAKATGDARKLPVVVLDGTISTLTPSASGSSLVYSAKVEFVIKREASLKGSVSGAAQAQDSADAATDAKRLASLQDAALTGAVESALRGAPQAIEIAAK